MSRSQIAAWGHQLRRRLRSLLLEASVRRRVVAAAVAAILALATGACADVPVDTAGGGPESPMATGAPEDLASEPGSAAEPAATPATTDAVESASTAVSSAETDPLARPTPSCGPVGPEILEVIEAALEGSGVEVVAASSWPVTVPETVFGVWEANAVRLAGGPNTEDDVALWLSVVYLLDLKWSSTIDQEVKVFSLNDLAAAVSSLPRPEPSETEREITANDPAVTAAIACLD